MWDGDRILAEDRQSSPSSAQTTGTVAYVHGPGLDQPLELLDSRSGQDGRVPNVNWRGLGESSSWTTGAPADCSLTGGSCTTINWPAGQGVYFEKPQSQSWPPPATWVGSLVANGEDGTSLLYRRNRFYDPASGQFTQEDPLGLAGGLNLYGFANGDPVNFSDPFGLCPVPATDCPFGYFTKFGLLAGLAAGAGAGAVAAAPTGELASPITVPTGAAILGTTGALAGLAADASNAFMKSSLGKEILQKVRKAVGTIALIISPFLVEPDQPPKRPDDEHKPPPAAPTSTKTVIPSDRDQEPQPQ